MLVFDSYPGHGRSWLGLMKGSNSRHEYLSEFLQKTGQRRCAYCGRDLTTSYEAWLTAVLDHVVPVSVCKSAGVPALWCWDYANVVLACGACNGFCNRYKPSFDVGLLETEVAFFDLRDKIFQERKKRIADRHDVERSFFDKRPWYRSGTESL